MLPHSPARLAPCAYTCRASAVSYSLRPHVEIAQGARNVMRPAMALDRGLPRGQAKCLTFRLIQGKPQNRLRQLLNIARRYQPRSPVMLQNFGQLIQTAGYDAFAHCHVLKKLGRRPEEPATVRHGNMR